VSQIHVIEAEHYREEEETLKADPIILALAAELPADFPVAELEAWSFISGASEEYQKRGGQDARSIGGPARAIRALKLVEASSAGTS
jgi:hypothetical protein